MQVAIYATEEKRRRTGFDHVLVLARRGEALILRRDRINACWVLPEAPWAKPLGKRCLTCIRCAPTA